MARVLVGFEQCQVRTDDGLETGFLEVGEDGVVRFARTSPEAVAEPPPVGSFAEHEEVAPDEG